MDRGSLLECYRRAGEKRSERQRKAAEGTRSRDATRRAELRLRQRRTVARGFDKEAHQWIQRLGQVSKSSILVSSRCALTVIFMEGK